MNKIKYSFKWITRGGSTVEALKHFVSGILITKQLVFAVRGTSHYLLFLFEFIIIYDCI